MKKIIILSIILPLVLSSCNILHTSSDNGAKYHLNTIQTNFGETVGPNVGLTGEYPLFEYDGENAQYARYCEELNDVLSREVESWTDLANDVLASAQEQYRENSELSSFPFGIDISCEVSNENGYPAVTFNVREVRGSGSGAECNYQIKYYTDDGIMIYQTRTETTRVY